MRIRSVIHMLVFLLCFPFVRYVEYQQAPAGYVGWYQVAGVCIAFRCSDNSCQFNW